MPSEISQAYFEWLIKQIRNRSMKSYLGLFEILHNKEFVWTVAGDQHRVRDAMDLRVDFLNYRTDISRKDVAAFKDEMINSATMLELIISLSRRVSFNSFKGTPDEWAWKLLSNIGLNLKYDPLTDRAIRKIDEILDTVIWRTYDRHGVGGFFPVENHPDDQRQVELWYQMNYYLIETQRF